MNCGRNDRKNSTTFGLILLANSPLPNRRSKDSSGKAAAPSTLAPPRLRKAPMPSHTRYSPPATFNAVNAVGEAASRADTPMVASTVCVRQPRAQPRPNAMPWRRPRDMPTPSTIRLSGPGLAVIKTAAARKARNWSGLSMNISRAKAP
ncbi:hypothetical protein D3C81_1762410 [compost metagenome]